MKAVLRFNLDDPDDQMAHKRCLESTKMAIALFEILNNSWRNVDTADDLKTKIEDICSDINLNELIY